jgi:hypothetical protein
MSIFILKIIALITMIIDHIGYALELNSDISKYLHINTFYCRLVGRIAFPIYAFLIAEGCKYTKDIKKYMKRLFLFALISEIPFDMLVDVGRPNNYKLPYFFSFSTQNVLFTLLFGVIVIFLFNKIKENTKILSRFINSITIVLVLTISNIFNNDYGLLGVLTIFFMYIAKNKMERFLVVVILALFDHIGTKGSLGIELLYVTFTSISIIPIYLYNGKVGIKLKYLFYWSYPIHMALICNIIYLYFFPLLYKLQ